MKTLRSKLVRLCLLGIPLLLAMIGFVWAEGEPFLHSLFMSVCMYLMGYQDVPANIWLELARWTAPLATASGILMAVAAMRRTIRNFLLYHTGDCTAVYGPEEEKQHFLAQIGPRGIDGEDAFVRARRYILLNDEAWNLAFYREHQGAMKDSKVYLKCRTLRPQSLCDPNLLLFCPEEIAARLYWKERCLYEASAEKGHRLRIVFLGFGKLGEELLDAGLQCNIFSPDQKVEYHIFGDGEQYLGVHTELSSVSDPVLFHGEPWHQQKELLESADLLIVLQQEDQMELLQDLLFMTVRKTIDVFTQDAELLTLLTGSERLRVFVWMEKADVLENLESRLLFERAMRINLRYAHLYGDVPETEENKEAEWTKLDSFTRYSNISAADYHGVRLNMLQSMGEPAEAEKLSPACMELLAELEHIRWERYHYLNNWRCGTPENGKRKDREARIHADLIPYEKLTEGEKEKDRENIRILLSVV